MIPILHIKGLHDKFFHSIPVIYLKTTEDDFKQWFDAYNLDKNHPVGSFWWSDNPENPHDRFGGTWERLEKVTLIGATDGGKYPVGSTGGKEEEKLDVPHLPPHQHRLIGRGGIDEGKVTGAILAPGDGNPDAMAFHRGGGWYDDGRYELEKVGEGKAHNNMQPYYATYLWQRVA